MHWPLKTAVIAKPRPTCWLTVELHTAVRSKFGLTVTDVSFCSAAATSMTSKEDGFSADTETEALLFAILKVRFQMIFRMPLFSRTNLYLLYFRTWNSKQVMGNILHGTQLNTLPRSRCKRTSFRTSFQPLSKHSAETFSGAYWDSPFMSSFRTDLDRRAHKQVIYGSVWGQEDSDSEVHFWKHRRKQKGDKPSAYSGGILIEPSRLMAKLNPNMTHVSVFMLDKLFLYCWFGIIRLS